MWWEPKDENGMFWPKEVPKNYRFSSFIKLFEFLKYGVCAHGKLEVGYEKVAVYKNVNTGNFTHVARQMVTGNWTSKLGPEEDIKHKSPEVLSGGLYGEVAVFMKRPCRTLKAVMQIPFALAGKLPSRS